MKLQNSTKKLLKGAMDAFSAGVVGHTGLALAVATLIADIPKLKKACMTAMFAATGLWALNRLVDTAFDNVYTAIKEAKEEKEYKIMKFEAEVTVEKEEP